ncbi:aspartate racemase [Crenobacter luteus]|uniref:aspartate/glutamate racemase family protein n=1 Tax=Crenobacter luteus TaxID=1452487 RepID=UPI00105098C0|nr:amino acid racemase [Crenobacter luteus]TCP10296.1 aspartate racemase [Crenobacter luteus]
MKTIGLIGGIGWESSAAYYQRLNRGVEARLGLPHSARCVLVGLDYADVEAADAAALAALMADAAQRLEAAGADALLIASNSLHKAADAVAAATTRPLIHIADAIGAQLAAQGVKTLALLGTRSTMEGPFIRTRLAERWGIATRVPDDAARRAAIDRAIYDELAQGQLRPDTRAALLADVASLQAGCDALLLGCSELPHAIRQSDVTLPLFESTDLHVAAALDFMLGAA